MFRIVKGIRGMRDPPRRTWERKEGKLRKNTPLALDSPLRKKKKASSSVNNIKQLTSLRYWRLGWHSARAAGCQPGYFIGMLFSTLPAY